MSWLSTRTLGALGASLMLTSLALSAQQPAVAPGNATGASPATATEVPADYVVGPEDVLTIVFWREKEMSGDVAVRPDGRISLPLLNEIVVAGLTTEELRARLTEVASQYLEEPTVTVIVKQINSRKVFITGQVGKPGAYPLLAPTRVVQLITMAGGVAEYADEDQISIIRIENGKQVRLRFNYKDFKKGKNLEQNVELKPGDTVIVP